MIGARKIDRVLHLFEQTGGEIGKKAMEIRSCLREKDRLATLLLIDELSEMVFTDEMLLSVSDLRSLVHLGFKEGIAGNIPDIVFVG